MTFKDLIPDSVLVINGCIKDNSITALEGVISHNYEVFSKFDTKILILNKAENLTSKAFADYVDMWTSVFPDIIFKLVKNIGHQLGAMWLEENSLLLAKNKSSKTYMWKFSDDWLITKDFLNVEILRSDFYYLPSLSMESVVFNKHREFSPQTNFYIVDVKKINTLYGNVNDYKIEKDKYPDKFLWEIPWEWKLCCEDTLAKYIKDQNLEIFNILNEDRFDELSIFVYGNNIGDPSHKNIFFEKEGLCHFHFPDDPIFYI